MAKTFALQTIWLMFDVTQFRASARRKRDPERSEERPNPWRTDSLHQDAFFTAKIVRQTRAKFRLSISKGSRGFESPSLRQRVSISGDTSLESPKSLPQRSYLIFVRRRRTATGVMHHNPEIAQPARYAKELHPSRRSFAVFYGG